MSNRVEKPLETFQRLSITAPQPNLGFCKIKDYKLYSIHLKNLSDTSVTKLVTLQLLKIYLAANSDFDYQSISNPRRVLTKSSKPAHNDGYDNEDYDYILHVNDVLGAQEGQRYQILDILGQGTFGQVVKCQNLKSKELVAIKVIKNKPAYYNQSLVEVAILEMLNTKYDKDDKHHIVRMKGTFLFRNHLCIVFEMLSVNLYELIKQNQFRGLSTKLVRVFSSQILDALVILQKSRIIHCDLKPENILLKNLESPSIKVIDFGSACHENQTIYTYIQSRFYRSPEVLLGLPYTSSIDMWSLGCIVAELFLGLPLFPGSSQYNQIRRIVDMLGVPPSYMCEKGKHSSDYFNKELKNGKIVFTLKSMAQYMEEQNTTESKPKKYLNGETLEEIIIGYPIMRKGLPPREVEREMYNRQSFLDFLKGLLNMNPLERWSPLQAIQHPFITGENFTAPYVPSEKAKYPMMAGNSDNGPVKKDSKSLISMFHNRRPRANTISSSKVQNVPPQLQRLIAAQQLQGSNKFPHPEAADRMRDLPQADGSHFSENMSNAGPSTAHYNMSPAENSGYIRRRSHNGQAESSSFGSRSTLQSSAGPTNEHASLNENESTEGAVLDDNSLQMYPDSGTNSSNTSFDRFPSEVLPNHGSTGERSILPSRIPSSATSAEWEMFDDLDNHGPYYYVSSASSVVSSQHASRQSSMMDMSVDYQSHQYNMSNVMNQNKIAGQSNGRSTYLSKSFSGQGDASHPTGNEQGDVPMSDVNKHSGMERKYSQGSLSISLNSQRSISNGSSKYSDKYQGGTETSNHHAPFGQSYQPPTIPFDSKRHSVNPEALSTSWQEKRQYNSNERRRPRRATHYDPPRYDSSGNHAVSSMPESVNIKVPVMEKRRFSDIANPQSAYGSQKTNSSQEKIQQSSDPHAEPPVSEHQHYN